MIHIFELYLSMFPFANAVNSESNTSVWSLSIQHIHLQNPDKCSALPHLSIFPGSSKLWKQFVQFHERTFCFEIDYFIFISLSVRLWTICWYKVSLCVWKDISFLKRDNSLYWGLYFYWGWLEPGYLKFTPMTNQRESMWLTKIHQR